MNKEIKVRIEFDLENYGCFDDPNNIEFDGEKLSYMTLKKVLSIIAYKYAYYKNYEYTPIMSDYFGVADVKKYLDFLKIKDVIKINNYYEKGKKPRSYCFNDMFKNRCNVSYVGYNGVVDSKNGKMDQRDKMLYKDLLDLDIVDTTINRTYIDINGVEVCKFKAYIKNHIELFNMKNNRTYKWRHDRVYTPFVFLNKEVRLNNFRYGEDELISLDIPSSFPLFLGIWCIKNGIDKECNEFREWCGYVKEGRISIKRFNKDPIKQSVIYRKLREMFDEIRNSDGKEVYDKVLDVWTKKDKPHVYYDKAKIYFQRWLNGNNSDSFINNVFKYNFSCINDLTIGKIMYYELEKLEKDFIFDIIIKRFYNEIKGIKILSCHDEVYFQYKYFDQAREIWSEELSKLYNMLPDEPDMFDGIVPDGIEEECGINLFEKFEKKVSKINRNIDWDNL